MPLKAARRAIAGAAKDDLRVDEPKRIEDAIVDRVMQKEVRLTLKMLRRKGYGAKRSSRFPGNQ